MRVCRVRPDLTLTLPYWVTWASCSAVRKAKMAFCSLSGTPSSRLSSLEMSPWLLFLLCGAQGACGSQHHGRGLPRPSGSG